MQGMTRNQIVEQYAKARKVEGFIRNAFPRLRQDVADDLAQEVYSIALTYDEGKVCDMYARGELSFWLARVMLNQIYNGRVRQQLVLFSQRSQPLTYDDNDERYADA